MELIIELALLFFIVPLIYAAGARRANTRPPAAPKHSHVWDSWTRNETRFYDPKTGEHIYNKSHQERSCIDCGYLEVEFF